MGLSTKGSDIPMYIFTPQKTKSTYLSIAIVKGIHHDTNENINSVYW